MRAAITWAISRNLLPNGTAVSVMTCARFGHGKAAIWAHLPNAWPGRPIFSTTAAGILPPASISSPHTMVLRCAIWSATTKKHNHANGEDNRDGHNENISYNHGIEGETEDAAILEDRSYTAKALLASLFLANGTPMLLAGDEFGNSQQGNNNSYCQDNPITWLDWQQADEALQGYTRDLIRLRQEIKLLGDDVWWKQERVRWLNIQGEPMSELCWHNRGAKAMQIVLDDEWLLLINAKRSQQIFNLPQGSWQISCVPSEKF